MWFSTVEYLRVRATIILADSFSAAVIVSAGNKQNLAPAGTRNSATVFLLDFQSFFVIS
jgi:hypothetical protein